MARLISQTGLTSPVNVGSPQEGMKWIVKWALVVLHTSTTTGSRQAAVVVIRGNNSINNGAILADTTSQSGTSTTYAGYGDVISGTIYSVPTAQTQFYQFPEVFAADIVTLASNQTVLQSGDTVDYYIMVEEAPS
jgi:hypothetical protein